MGPGREAGDVDGDGTDDLAVGRWTSSAAGENAGEVTVFSGRTGDPMVQMTGTRAATYLGFDAIGLGDLTGDRVPDLAVSAAGGERGPGRSSTGGSRAREGELNPHVLSDTRT